MKNKQTVWICVAFIAFVFAHSCSPFPTTMPKNEHVLQTINNVNAYKALCSKDSNQKMVNLQAIIPNIVLDLRYASENNFMHRNMYPSNLNYTFLRLPVAKTLALIQTELSKKGLGLKVFDAYRPYAVTQKFGQLVHDERYVANPTKGSGHNRGTTIDITIINLQTNQELDMGTGFDNFSDSAHQSFTALPKDVLANRRLLKETMEHYGFKALETEWWHYGWPNSEKFDVLNLSFKDLKKTFNQ